MFIDKIEFLKIKGAIKEFSSQIIYSIEHQHSKTREEIVEMAQAIIDLIKKKPKSD